MKNRALLTALVAAAIPVWAHHRQTPPVTTLTTSGDTALPRLPSPSKKTMTFVQSNGAVVTASPFRDHSTLSPVTGAGDNANPSVSYGGTIIAWDTTEDPLNSGAPGHQVMFEFNGILVQAAVDPTGTSENPAIDLLGTTLVFESEGDLASTGNSGVRQIFLRRFDGSITQLTAGQGDSRNPGVSAKGRRFVWESTTHPISGVDTPVSQIWTASTDDLIPAAVTAGAADSTFPILSDDGRVIAFESRADLGSGGADMGVTQIFVYDTKSATFAQVTHDAGGCSAPAVARVKRDWRVAFVCSGQAYFYMLRTDERFQIATFGGHTTRLLPQLGAHFMSIATTGNLAAGSGTTAGHRIYFLNIFANPPAEVAATPATWFPSRGIPALH